MLAALKWPLHGLAEEVGREEGVEGRGPVVLVVGGAPDAAAEAAASPHVGSAAQAAGRPGVDGRRLAEAAVGRVGGGRGPGGLLLTAAARLGKGADNVLDLVFVGNGGENGGVAQHTVVQRVLSLKEQKLLNKRQ